MEQDKSILNDYLASCLVSFIKTKVDQYSAEELYKSFPQYLHTISPEIAKILITIAEIRTNNTNFINSSDYFTEIKKLVDFNMIVDYHIPSLEENRKKAIVEEQKQRRAAKANNLKNIFLVAFLAFVGTLLVAFFVWKFGWLK